MNPVEDYRPTMPEAVVHDWAQDAQKELVSLRARVTELERENANLLAQRNESLSMVGAIVGAQGGEVRIPDSDLMVGYAFESHRDPLHHATILRVVAD